MHLNNFELVRVLEHELMVSCKQDDNSTFDLAHALTKLSHKLDENDYLDILEYVLGDLEDIDRDLWDFCDLLSSYME